MSNVLDGDYVLGGNSMSFFKELKEDIVQSVNELSDSIEDTVADPANKPAGGADSTKDKKLETEVQNEINSILEGGSLLDGIPMPEADAGDNAGKELSEKDKGKNAGKGTNSGGKKDSDKGKNSGKDKNSGNKKESEKEKAPKEEKTTEEMEPSKTALSPDATKSSEMTLSAEMTLSSETEKEIKKDIVMDQEEKAVDTLKEMNEMEDMNMDSTEETTVITKGTTINGGIKSDTSLLVKGVIEGDVDCMGKLTITGRVAGNSTAAEIYVNTPKLEGNLESRGSVKIDVGTVVIGNVSGASVVVAGAVKGDIEVNGPIIVDSTAVVKGNIIGKSVQINSGAVIDGFCSLKYADVDLDSFFE